MKEEKRQKGKKIQSREMGRRQRREKKYRGEERGDDKGCIYSWVFWGRT